METRIKDIVIASGADLCGIANIDRFDEAPSGFHPADIYPGCRSVVVFAKCLPKGLRYAGPRMAYTKALEISLHLLDQIGYAAALAIEKLDQGILAVPLPCDTPYDYWDDEHKVGKGVLSMRHAALFSGLGSMGKNNLIITKEYGNMIDIGALLTNLDLRSDPLAETSCMENCRICLDKCPAKALDGLSVNQALCRKYTSVRNDRGFEICNCHTCRTVCPKCCGG